MGLDAFVFCDCFERGRLRSPPPPGCSLSVSENGSLLCGSDDLDTQIAFDCWQQSDACEHEDGCLVAHRIGNISLVASLRAELQRSPDRFPMILSLVLYSGTHCGDFIPAAEVPQVLSEAEALAGVHCPDPEMECFLREFEEQMRDLVSAALRVGKPIAF